MSLSKILTCFQFLALTTILASMGILAACRQSPDSQYVPSRIGDLICAESYCPTEICQAGYDESTPLIRIPSCPVVVVEESDQGNHLRIAGSFGLHGWVSSENASTYEKSVGNSLIGATENVYLDEFGYFGLRFPTLANPYYQIGLIYANGSQKDTLSFQKAPPLGKSLDELLTLDACLNSVRNAKGFGLLHSPLLPVNHCSIITEDYWVVKDDHAMPPKRSYDSMSCMQIEMVYKAKSLFPNSPVFLGLGCGLWLFSHAPDMPHFVKYESSTENPDEPREEDNIHVSGIQIIESNDGGVLGWVVETSRIYGDGSYQDLTILSFDQPMKIGPQLHSTMGSGTLNAKVIGVRGSSGEPGGADVQGIWWVAHQKVFSVWATEGNDNVPELSHDITAEVFEMDSTGKLESIKSKGFFAILIGKPTTLLKAAFSVEEAKKKAPAVMKSEIRALPRLTTEGLEWQAGAMAPDAESAKEWTKWDNSIEVKEIPNYNYSGH